MRTHPGRLERRQKSKPGCEKTKILRSAYVYFAAFFDFVTAMVESVAEGGVSVK